MFSPAAFKPIDYRPGLSTWPLYLAPLEGISNPELRDLFSSLPMLGCVSTEFIRISNNTPSTEALKENIFGKYEHLKFDLQNIIPEDQRLDFKSFQKPTRLSVQVMGDNVQHMLQSAQQIEKLEVDFIDLNFGCPAPLVYAKGCGSAMLKNPDKMFDLVSTIKKTLQKPLTAKMRAGIAEGDDFVSIALGLEAAGIEHLTLHARTKNQVYEGSANHLKTQALVKALKIPVIANGDLFFARNILEVAELSSCAGFMLGRGALCNPFIFWQIASYVKTGQKLAVPGTWIVEYYHYLAELFAYKRSAGGALNRIKEIVRFSKHLLPQAELLNVLLRSQSLAEILDHIRQIYTPLSISF